MRPIAANIPQHRYCGGTEMEFAVLLRRNPAFGCTDELVRTPNEYEIAELIAVDLSEQMNDANNPQHFAGVVGSFGSNGARIYREPPDKVEYATPECHTYEDTVHAGEAGERIVVRGLEKFIERKEYLRGSTVLSRVADDTGKSWGAHENYLVDRRIYPTTYWKTPAEADSNLLCRLMLAHLATRTIFVGAGLYRFSRHGREHFELSQKIPTLRTDMAGTSTGAQKPLLNIRLESLTDDTKYSRLHITPGDYNLSPWAHWMRIGTTAIMAYLAEAEMYEPKGELAKWLLPLGKALPAAKGISQRVHHTFRLENGRKVLAIDVQEGLCEVLERFDERHPYALTAEDKEVKEEWRWAIDAHRNSPDALTQDVDWRKRQEIVETYRAARPGAKPEELEKVQQAYENLRKGLGVKQRVRTRMPGYSPEAVDHHMHSAPAGGRAEVRGNLIKTHRPPERAVCSTIWTGVTITNRTTSRPVETYHWLPDPFATESREMQQHAA